MTHYSSPQRKAMIERYRNSGLSIRDFSESEGIPKSTLYSWSQQFKLESRRTMNTQKSKTGLSAEQRFTFVLETAVLSESKLHQYCREKGIYPEQIKQWKRHFIESGNRPVAVSNPVDKKRIRSLEKELHRKEKALAETAALLVLRKKFNARFGVGEEE